MKSNYLLLAVVTGLGSTMAASAGDNQWLLKPGARAIHFDNKRMLDEESVGGSLGLEYQYGRWGTELQLWTNQAEVGGSSNSVDANGGTLNQYLYLTPDAAFRPYLVMGAGHGDYDGRFYDQQETQAHAGVGFNHRLADRLSWWMDVRGVHGVDNSATDSVLGMGLAFHFGQAPAQPVVVAPADSDGDTVTDNLDACPNTPVGVAVDGRGCELDSDGDGVVDRQDQCPASAVGEKVNRVGCKEQVTRVEEIRMEVHFNSGATVLLPAYESSVQNLAQFMKKFPQLNVIIEGHTDSTGPAAFNQQLSAQRAQAIKDALVSRYGVAAGRITVQGFGESRPVASNDTAEGRKENRRVIAVLTTTVVE